MDKVLSFAKGHKLLVLAVAGAVVFLVLGFALGR